MTFVSLIPIILIAALFIEKVLHKYWVEQIPLRISVNGTRGKSSVTQFIAVGLRSAGMVTLGKITGTEPVLIGPDGNRSRIKRWGSPRIQEQLKVVYQAAKTNIDVLVAECMAVSPEIQTIDSRIICPHIVVITNILDDHREQFGGDLKAYAEAICSTIPHRSTVVTTEVELFPFIQSYAKELDATVIVPKPIHSKSFPQGIHRANVELAVEVCRLAGMDRDEAETNILGQFKKLENTICSESSDGIRFINGLAANDTQSASHLLDEWHEPNERRILLLHTRSDRPLRTIQFAEWMASLADVDHVLLSGTHSFVARRKMRQCGFPLERVTMTNNNPFDCFRKIETSDVTVYGFGNTGDQGNLHWTNLMQNYREMSRSNDS